MSLYAILRANKEKSKQQIQDLEKRLNDSCQCLAVLKERVANSKQQLSELDNKIDRILEKL